MINLPADILAKYRPATAAEVRSWSFGQLSARRQSSGHWKSQRGTLDDQVIFGPVHDFKCACGKYNGRRHEGMICDRCGVKLTTHTHRRKRFGHIELVTTLPHPCCEGMISALPVLPAVYFCSDAGKDLGVHYDRLVELNKAEREAHMLACLERLFVHLAPVLVTAHRWDLQESATLARGLGLVCRGMPAGDDCCECGYPLTGLDTPVCPGCGRKVGGP